MPEPYDTALYDDTVRVLTGWRPADPDVAAARDRTLALLADGGPAALGRDHRAGHVTASAAVLDADHRRTLLCLHGKVHRWMQLGGHCEPTDTTIAGAALREAIEESGIPHLRPRLGPVHLDIHSVICNGQPSHHYDVRFVLVAPPGAVEHVSDESDALGWFPPDDLPEPLAHATAPLLTAALDAAAAWRDPPGVRHHPGPTSS